MRSVWNSWYSVIQYKIYQHRPKNRKARTANADFSRTNSNSQNTTVRICRNSNNFVSSNISVFTFFTPKKYFFIIYGPSMITHISLSQMDLPIWTCLAFFRLNNRWNSNQTLIVSVAKASACFDSTRSRWLDARYWCSTVGRPAFL